MILVDEVGHLVSDAGTEELHRFAHLVGLRRHWYRGGRGHPHYDVTTARARRRVIAAGATVVSSRELVRRMVRAARIGKELPLFPAG